ncbi:MAG: hypothetical protein ACREFJ_18870 [Acetobacteraceae bacterium]
MKTLLLCGAAALAVMAIDNPASHAQARPQAGPVIAAVQSLNDAYVAATGGACPARLTSGLIPVPVGTPGDVRSEIRCQSVLKAAYDCDTMAASAGSFRQMVNNGESTYRRLYEDLPNQPRVSRTGALLLAEEMPQSMAPATIVRTVFFDCMQDVVGAPGRQKARP